MVQCTALVQHGAERPRAERLRTNGGGVARRAEWRQTNKRWFRWREATLLYSRVLLHVDRAVKC